MPRAISVNSRIRPLLLVLVLSSTTIGGCQPRQTLSDSGPVGQVFSLPPRVKQLDATFPITGCRVIVITTWDCGVSKALIQGWRSEVEANLDSAGLKRSTGWIVFGDDKRAAGLLSLAGGRPVSALIAPGDLRDIKQWLGLDGTPHTLIIDEHETIRAVVSGNYVPSTATLNSSCHPHVGT